MKHYKCYQPLTGMDDFDCLQIAFEIMMLDMGDLPGFQAGVKIEENFPKDQTKAEQEKRLTAMLKAQNKLELSRSARKTPDAVLQDALNRLDNELGFPQDQQGTTAWEIVGIYLKKRRKMSLQEQLDAHFELKGQRLAYRNRVLEFPYFASDFWGFCKQKYLQKQPLFSNRVVIREEEAYPKELFTELAPKTSKGGLQQKIALFLCTPRTINEIEQEFGYSKSGAFLSNKNRINDIWNDKNLNYKLKKNKSNGKWEIIKLC
ncbi:hypothetical protein [Vampirovibrio sp.]|uniref:hypothetical protein n=1 Tax=Vampirovibrio sp. TaxID=2717857 RepID=UPI00359302DD